MESFYSKYKSFNWDEIIRHRLTSYRNAARYGRKSHLTIIQTLKSIIISKHKSALRHKKQIIIFGSKRQAENQLKTYLYHHICLTITQQQKSCVMMDKDCSQSQCLSISPLQRIPSLGNTMLKT